MDELSFNSVTYSSDPKAEIIRKGLLGLSTGNKENKPLNKKGFFSSEEVATINNIICEYAVNNNKNSLDILNEINSLRISNKNNIYYKNNSIFYYLCKALPLRSCYSIYKYCLKHYDNFNYKNNALNSNVNNDLYDILFLLSIINSNTHFNVLKFNYIFSDFISDDSDDNFNLYKISDNKTMIINETIKHSVDHNQKLIIVKNIIDFKELSNLLLDSHNALDWETITMQYNSNNIMKSKETLIEQWELFLKDFKINELCEIKKDLLMIKR